MRELNENPSLRRKRIEHILDDRIDDEGGPLVYILESEESLQHSLDYTSRKLFQFLGQSSVLNRKITHRFPRRGII